MGLIYTTSGGIQDFFRGRRKVLFSLLLPIVHQRGPAYSNLSDGGKRS